MAKEKRFSFIPENQLNVIGDGHIAETVRISTTGLLCFSKSLVENYQLENSFIKMYADAQKKAIAWTIFTDHEVANGAALKLRQLKPYGPGKEIKISVAKILKSMGVTIKKSLLKLPVKQYEDILEKKTFFYVTLK